MQIQEYLSKKGFQYKIINGEANMNCPFCNDKEQKFYINIESGLYQCKHANRCNVTGNFYQLQKALGDTPRGVDNDRFIKPKKEYKMPGKLERAQEPTDKFLAWFKSRGIESATISKFNIHIQDKWIVFPVYKNGKLVNRKYRDIEKNFRAEKDAELCLIGREQLSDNTQDIIICEGEIDMLTWTQLGYSALSVPSGINNLVWIGNDYEYLKKFKTIYLSMDMDDIGRKTVKEIASRLGKWRCYDVLLPFKDINDCLMKKVPLDEIMRCIDNAKGYDLPELKSADCFIDEVEELIKNADAYNGLSTGYKGLDNVIRGWREGELTIWTGKAGSGKSTFLNQVLMKVITKHNQPICIGSFEMPPKRLLSWLVAGDKPGTIRETLTALKNHLYIIDITGEINPDNLFDIMQFGAMKYGIKHFLVDSLMRIKLSKYNELQHQTEFAGQLVAFAQDFNCHMHLIAHPRKTERDTDIVQSTDISGSGNITNLAHNVIIMHRYTEETKQKMKTAGTNAPDNILIIKKCREFGDQGKVALMFNKFSKQFYEVEHENKL